MGKGFHTKKKMSAQSDQLGEQTGYIEVLTSSQWISFISTILHSHAFWYMCGHLGFPINFLFRSKDTAQPDLQNRFSYSSSNLSWVCKCLKVSKAQCISTVSGPPATV